MTSKPVLTDEERQAKLKNLFVRKILDPTDKFFGYEPPKMTGIAEPRLTPRTTNASVIPPSVVHAPPSHLAPNTNYINHNNANAIANVRSNNFSNNFTKQTFATMQAETFHQPPVPLTQSPRKIVAVAPAKARETHKEQTVSSILNGSIYFNGDMDVEEPAARRPSPAVVNSNNNSSNSNNRHNPASNVPTLAPNPTTNTLVNTATSVNDISDEEEEEEILEKVKDGGKNGLKAKTTIAKKLVLLGSDSEERDKLRRSPRKHAPKIAREEDSLEELRMAVDNAAIPPKKRVPEPESISVSSDEEDEPLRVLGKAAKEADVQFKRKRASSLGEDDPEIFTFPSSKFKPVLPIEVPQLEKIGNEVMESPKKKEKLVRQYWARTEDDALIAGIAHFGYGNWKVILDNYHHSFHPKRKGMSLKDRANQLKKLGVIDNAGNKTSKKHW